MKIPQWISQLDLLLDVAGHVQHLRKLVIHLAVTGRLVSEVDANSAHKALLKSIAAKRGL